MRRRIVTWITMTLFLAGMGLLLDLFPGGGRGFDNYRMGLGYSLSILGFTFLILMRWPEPGQSDVTALVSLAVFVLPRWLVALRARWRITWRQVAYGAWGALLLLSLTAVILTLFGDLVSALILDGVVVCLNFFGMLLVMLARMPVRRRQQ